MASKLSTVLYLHVCVCDMYTCVHTRLHAVGLCVFRWLCTCSCGLMLGVFLHHCLTYLPRWSLLLTAEVALLIGAASQRSLHFLYQTPRFRGYKGAVTFTWLLCGCWTLCLLGDSFTCYQISGILKVGSYLVVILINSKLMRKGLGQLSHMC